MIDDERKVKIGHPAAEAFSGFGDEDHQNLISLQTHDSPAHLKCQPPEGKKCATGFPKMGKEVTDVAAIYYEPRQNKQLDKTYTVHVLPPRPVGNEFVNQYCRSLLHLLRCNQDCTMVNERDRFLHYLLKYVTKPET